MVVRLPTRVNAKRNTAAPARFKTGCLPDGFDGSLGPRCGTGPVLRHRREAVESSTGLTAVFEIVYEGRKTVCGSVEAKPGRFPRNERREIKVNLLESMMPFLSGGSRFDQCLGERHTCAIDLGTDFLGKPIVREAGLPRLSVSFSQGEALMWAAICQNGVCGVDSAHSEEFRGAYPFKRAFHEDEFESLSAGTDVSREEAAAILWSVKEAAVKALGCGFHLIDPLQMNVVSVGVRSAGLLSTAVVSGLGESIRELREQLAVHVVTFPFRTEWVSLAYEDVGLEW